MQIERHAPSLSLIENIRSLPPRDAPYWNIIAYCRHIGLRKTRSGAQYWLARVRRVDGGYSQLRIGVATEGDRDAISYEHALNAAKLWFESDEVQRIASSPFAVGGATTVAYSSRGGEFTIGDAMVDLMEWKRVSAAKSYFGTSLSLINHHIIPRLGDVPVEEFTARRFTAFCTDVLESAPRRGNQKPQPGTRLEDLDHEALRKRKKTLNTLIGILRMGVRMAWENSEIASERAWLCLRRVPHADTPRHIFLTRKQAKRLISECRPDLARLVYAALYTGCRVSELSQLKARDIGNHVFGIYVAPLKSYRGRYVILPDEGMSFFLDQMEGKDEEDLVFTMASGKSWSGSHKHLFREAVRRAALPSSFVFHGLRHTYASQLVQAGVPLAIVARQLGHSNTDTVSRTYGHLSCSSIETQLTSRFAPLVKARSDSRLAGLRDTLQAPEEPAWSWPRRNRSTASGQLVATLRAREDELRKSNLRLDG